VLHAFVGAGGEADAADAELRQHLVQQVLGAAVDGLTVHDPVAGPQEGQQRGRDGAHAAGEDERALRIIPQAQALLQHLQIRVVDARIDQPGLFARLRLAQPVRQLEERLAILGLLEHERRCMEDRALERALGQQRVVAVAHHQRLGPCSF
jgi:hypothetical protein